jgi:hypothetical protein
MTMKNDAMEIDPIDDGPVISTTPTTTTPSTNTNHRSTVNYNHNDTTTTTMMKPYRTDPPVYADSTNTTVSTITTTTLTTLSLAETKLYIDQMRSEDLNVRIHAAYVWDAMARTLGPERTRTVRVLCVCCV